MKHTQNSDFDAAKYAVDKGSYTRWLEDSRLDEAEKENEDPSSSGDSHSPLDTILNFLADGMTNATWRERLGALFLMLAPEKVQISSYEKMANVLNVSEASIRNQLNTLRQELPFCEGGPRASRTSSHRRLTLAQLRYRRREMVLMEREDFRLKQMEYKTRLLQLKFDQEQRLQKARFDLMEAEAMQAQLKTREVRRLLALDAKLFDQEMGIDDASRFSPLPPSYRRQ